MIKGRIVIVRHNDLDGIGVDIISRLYCKYVLNNPAVDERFIFNHRDKTIDICVDDAIEFYMLGEGDMIIVADGCPTLGKIKEVIGKKIRMEIYDHHVHPCTEVLKGFGKLDDTKKFIGDINSFLSLNIVMDTMDFELNGKRIKAQTSATLICFMEMFRNVKNPDILNMKNIALFAWIVSTYDTFVFEKNPDLLPEFTEDAPKLNMIFGLLGERDFETFVMPRFTNKAFRNMPIFPLPKDYETMCSVKQKITDNQIEYLMKKIMIKNNGEGNLVEAYVFSNVDTSLLGQRIAKKFPNVDIVYIIDMTGNVSLRTRKPDKVDCAAIAKQYGGGGHIEAAGFQLKGTKHQGVLEMINSVLN